jgi:TonB family protein
VPPPAKTIERRSPGDVVSVPLGKRFLDSVKILVGGDKSSPEFASRLSLGYGDVAPEIEGEVKGRLIVSRPDEPQTFMEAPRDASVEIQFSVNAEGAVISAEVIASSGNPAVDFQWLRHVKAWEFAPLGLNRPSIDQYGRVRFRLDKGRA